MVLGILTSIAACPAIVGTNQAVLQGQHQAAKDKHRGLKTNLYVHCTTASRGGIEVNGGVVVLRNNCLWVAVAGEDYLTNSKGDHPFAGYFLPYPEKRWTTPRGEGMVSTIMDDPPQLNWIYVDVETCEVKYGNRIDSQDHLVGPWDCTKIDRRLLLEGWEGFLAVHVGPGEWQLFFDIDDNGLKGIIPPKTRTVEVELERRERRVKKPEEDIEPE